MGSGSQEMYGFGMGLTSTGTVMVTDLMLGGLADGQLQVIDRDHIAMAFGVPFPPPARTHLHSNQPRASLPTVTRVHHAAVLCVVNVWGERVRARFGALRRWRAVRDWN